MTPKSFDGPTNVLTEFDENVETINNQKVVLLPRKYDILWMNVILFIYLHVASAIGLYQMFFANWRTIALYFVIGYISLLGVTAGVHRLWSHRSYKAKLPLRIFLLIAHTISFQDTIIEWASRHRVHHKYSDTDADPHNSKRGFFYSHAGWLLAKFHEDYILKGKGIDTSDLTNDPLLKFQQKYYPILVTIACFIIPVALPMYLWNESFMNAHFLNMLRYFVTSNCTWLINSAAHLYGNKPYDRYINPSENWIVGTLALGEGWHNYHHTFPWDYKASEFGYRLDHTAIFIHMMAFWGLAYDLKSVVPETIEKRVRRTGDGSHELWGYGDKDLTKADKSGILVTHEKQR